MLRPKRAASQKTKPAKQQKEDSDEDGLNLSEESSGDFSSASSDEWNPAKKKEEETFDGTESELEESESEGEEEESESAAESPVKQKKSKGNRSLVATLRGSTGNKFKRPHENRAGSSNLLEILQRAQYQKKKSILDDSKSDTREKTPDFDCSGGLRLSGSSDSEDDGPSTSAHVNGHEKKQGSALIDSINKASGSTMMDLGAIHNNLQQMEAAKAKLMNYEKKKNLSGSHKENFNISDLLAMGEGAAAPPSTSHKKSSQKRAHNTQGDDSDSDGWEEVADDEPVIEKIPHQGVEIMLNDFNQQEGKKKDAKPVDLEAQMKRKLNKRRKEYQQHLHKVNLMLWISHGNFVNQKLNNKDLMARALELLPKNKNHCYPKDQTDLDYFQQITNWFKSAITLRNKDMYTVLKQRPPLMISLALQMKFKAAICRRDYVLIFTILLRAIGIHCRMVQSLVCAPILPPKSELLSLSTKKPDEKLKANSSSSKSKSSGSSKSKAESSSTKRTSSSKSQGASHIKSAEKKSSAIAPRSSRSKTKKATEQPVIPQLDGGDDLPSVSKARKNLRIKALSGYKVDESYVDINKDENDNPKSLTTILKSPRTRSKSVTRMTPKVRFSLGSPNQSPKTSSQDSLKPGSSKKPTKDLIKKVQVAAAGASPRKTRATIKDAPTKTETKKVNLKNPSEKIPEITKASNNKNPKAVKDTLQVFSPRRLRSRSRSNDEKSDEGSAKKPNMKQLCKSDSPKVVKDTLQLLSPKRLRNSSRNDGGTKPNLQNLQTVQNRKRPAAGKEEVETKKVKIVPKVAGTKRAAEVNSTIKKKKGKPEEEEDDSDYDADTDESQKLFKKNAKKKTKAKTSPVIDRRVLSSDSEDEAGPSTATSSPSKKSKGIDIWVEAYSEKEQRWIAIDVLKGKVDSSKDIVKLATHPMVYVFAWNNDKSLKDVSARYCPNLNTTIRKMRVESKYLNSIIGRFEGIKTARDVKEDDELNMLQIQKPMPTSVAEFKNHPLYALKRHLLKYQAIYPPEPPILGYIREEAIYPRDCVFLLHTRETWLKEARVVKLNEEAYKITKTLKWDNVRRKLIKDVPQELFGLWQTKEYEPPVAENGMVPRNAYGNVELFKPSMLPIGTVHLQLPGLNKVCKKIGVDCSQAIVGFDSNGGWPYPVYDGFIVCKEFEEKVIDAWNREQEEMERKENEKYEKRVYGNWKKLIKGLLIRQRLKNKYNFEGDA